ncbi:MAG: NHL repeat-containing protein [Chthoniobacterales bacterium]
MRNLIFVRLFPALAAFGAILLPLGSAGAPGDLYVSNPNAGAIYKYTPNGDQSTFASGLTAPLGLAFDRAGNLFVGEGDTGDIFKFTPGGEKSTFASGLSLPFSLAFDGTGNLFVAESFGEGSDILKFTPSGTKTTFVSGEYFSGLTFDPVGNLFVATGGPLNFDGGVVWFTPDGTSHTFSYSGGPGLAFDGAGNFYVTSSDGILKYTPMPASDKSVFVSRPDNGSGLAFDDAGNLFETDSNSGSILKFAADGTESPFVSGLGPSPVYLAFEPVTEKLRNISARGLVGTDDNVLIGGFIVGGNALANNAVVVRAIGPSLAQAGIANALADPVLELHNSSGALLSSNEDWQDTQAAQISASGLAPTDPKESAIFATLPAGAYTAVVRGAGDTTGVALVEVYSISQ